MKRDTVLGLDFGSTKAAVAVLSAAAVFPDLARNELANRTTPAIVVFSDQGRLMGEAAELVKTRGGAIGDIKARVLSGSRATVPFQGESVELETEHLVGMMGGRLFQDVERWASNNGVTEVPRKVVVCIPASMSEVEAKKMHQGLQLVGYDVIGEVYDVSCAALVFAHRATQSGEKEASNVCFVDIGHEFVSVQVAHVDPANATLKVLATNSRAGCGAGAFAQVLVSQWVELLATKHKVVLDKLESAKQRERAFLRLNVQAEKAKNMLSGLSEVDVTVDSVVPELDLRTKVSRASMEAGATHVTASLKELLETTVKQAGLEASDVTRVELVGGGSRIPCVQEVVRELFGANSLCKTLDNECSCAMGAALFAGIIEGSVEFKVEGTHRGPDYLNAAGLSDDALAAAKALEERMQAHDAAVTARNDAKNHMEQWVFETRREASEKHTPAVDDAEALEKLQSLLSTAEFWLQDETDDVEAAVIEARLASTQEEAKSTAPKLFEALEKRAEKERIARLEEAQKTISVEKSTKKKHMRPAEKIEDAKQKRESGNKLMMDNNYEDASRRYTQALGICAEMDGTLSPDDQSAVNDIKNACYLNLCLVNVKLKLPKLGVYNATKAIEMFPEKPKGYLRRAQARYEVKEFEDAKTDLVVCEKLDPENAVGWKALLTKTEKAIVIQKDKQKKVYGKMFG